MSGVENCSVVGFYGDCVYVGMNPAPTGLNWSENIEYLKTIILIFLEDVIFLLYLVKNITFRNNVLDRHTGYVAMIDIEPNNDARARIRDIYIEGNKNIKFF